MSGAGEELVLSDYDAYIAGGRRVRAFLGARVALVIDDGCGALAAALAAPATGAGSPAAAAAAAAARAGVWSLVRAVEALLRDLDHVVGRAPALSAGDALRGRSRVEVAFLPGAAGLAHHGRAGFAVGPAFVEEWLRGAAAGAPALHHVFTYESVRNYIFPDEFTAVFDYACRQGPHSWGWVNQGFVNILGCLCCVDSGVAFTYHGYTAEQFCAQMEADLAAYRDGAWPWSEVFENDRLPWNAGRSLDNLYSGLLVALWRAHGRRRFLRRWFCGAIPLLLARVPASKADVATARENFFLAACYAARADLTPLFAGTLRWPLRADVPGVLATVLAAGAADEELW